MNSEIACYVGAFLLAIVVVYLVSYLVKPKPKPVEESLQDEEPLPILEEPEINEVSLVEEQFFVEQPRTGPDFIEGLPYERSSSMKNYLRPK